MRAFLALPVPEPVQDILARLQDEMDVGRPVAPENFHVTLAFLDDQSQAQLLHLHDGLSEVVSSALQLRIKGLSCLGGKTPRVLVADVDADAALVALHRKLRNVVQAAGIALPRVRFRPHVTLLRFARKMDAIGVQRLAATLQQQGGFELAPFEARQFNLYQSVLLPTGPRYEVLAEYPLGDDAAL